MDGGSAVVGEGRLRIGAVRGRDRQDVVKLVARGEKRDRVVVVVVVARGGDENDARVTQVVDRVAQCRRRETVVAPTGIDNPGPLHAGVVHAGDRIGDGTSSLGVNEFA